MKSYRNIHIHTECCIKSHVHKDVYTNIQTCKENHTIVYTHLIPPNHVHSWCFINMSATSSNGRHRVVHINIIIATLSPWRNPGNDTQSNWLGLGVYYDCLGLGVYYSWLCLGVYYDWLCLVKTNWVGCMRKEETTGCKAGGTGELGVRELRWSCKQDHPCTVLHYLTTCSTLSPR